MNLLIVDDIKMELALYKRVLINGGYSNLFFAECAEEAFKILDLTETSCDAPVDIDLILMDKRMPQINGIEACRMIKSNPRLRDIPVIMITAVTDSNTLKAAFEAGVMDYIKKGSVAAELLPRVRSALALKQEMDQRKARELEIADIGSSIQQNLLFSPAPDDIPGFQMAALTIPSQRIDGDFYEFFKHNDQCFDILIADVMGKGVSAALIGVATKTHFFRAIHQLFSLSDRNIMPMAKDIVMAVHNRVTKELISLGAFVTVCYGRFDMKRRQIDLVDCGHTKTIHYHYHNGTTTLIKSPNVPLGWIPEEIYAQISVDIKQGDIFFFYSDGITEAQNGSGEFFGEARLDEVIQIYGHHDPEELIEKVRSILVEFCGSENFADDLTCIAVKIME